jgi:hypothetical protein
MSTFRELINETDSKVKKAYLQSIVSKVEQTGKEKYPMSKKAKVSVDGIFAEMWFKSEDGAITAKDYIKSVIDSDKFAIKKKIEREGKSFGVTVVDLDGAVVYDKSILESTKDVIKVIRTVFKDNLAASWYKYLSNEDGSIAFFIKDDWFNIYASDEKGNPKGTTMEVHMNKILTVTKGTEDEWLKMCKDAGMRHK